MNRDILIFIKHIEENINDIEMLIRNLNKNSFFRNKEKQNAVVRSLEIIGEAVKNIPESFRKKYPSVEWKEIAGMRDKLVHHYFGVNLENVWKVVKEDIPVLKRKIKKILKEGGK